MVRLYKNNTVVVKKSVNCLISLGIINLEVVNLRDFLYKYM